MIHIHGVRRFALAALLMATACGDDGGDDDDVTPQPDGASGEAGATEAGPGEGGVAGDAGTIDGGGGNPDASTDLDARTPLPDGGPADAGNPELQAALNKADVRFDMRRSELVIPAFCRTGALCQLLEVTEQECLDQLRTDWTASVMGGDVPGCLDAQLDFLSCGAQLSCNAPEDACEADAVKVAELCLDDDGG